jgi:hypothetical protein
MQEKEVSIIENGKNKVNIFPHFNQQKVTIDLNLTRNRNHELI